MIRFVLLLVCLLLPVTAAAEPLTIGLSLSLSGNFEQLGLMQRQGYELWQRHINSDGGLLGRKVELIVQDDESSPAQAAKIYQDLIEKERVDLIFSPYSSSITAAVAPVVEKHGYPMIAAGASADVIWEQGYACLFGLYSPANRYTVGFLELLLRSGITDIALVSADDTFSRSITEGALIWIERFGLTTSFVERFAKGTGDLRAVVTRVRDSGAQAVIVCGHLQEAVDVRRALALIGWQPQAYFATVGPVLPVYGDTLGAQAQSTFSSSQWEAASAAHFTGGERFLADFAASYGLEPSYHAASAYAAGQILAKAIERAGSIEHRLLCDVLSTMDSMSIIGRYGVDNTGLQIRHFPLIIQWQNGRKQVVWPEEIRSAQPLFPRGAVP